MTRVCHGHDPTSAAESLHLTLCFCIYSELSIYLLRPGQVSILPETTEHFSMLTLLSLFFLIWACWRLYFRRRFLRTVLDVVPGPPGESWLTGEEQCYPWTELSCISWLDLGSLDQLFGQNGWEFHRAIAETCKCEIEWILKLCTTYQYHQMDPWYE